MYFELQEDGFVRIINGTNLDYRPTNSQIIKRDGKIYILAAGTRINNSISFLPNEIEGSKCDPPVRTDTIDNMIQDLQQIFNPNFITTNTSIQLQMLEVLNKMLDELRRIR